MPRERRVHPRVQVALPVELDVDDYGPTAKGSTVDLSRGGVLMTVDLHVEVGARCTVRFPMAGVDGPEVKSGRVVRSGPVGSGFLVALQFDGCSEDGTRSH